nr:PD-(D/E)XK nuclease family protein [Saprospiraceae bacterium]
MSDLNSIQQLQKIRDLLPELAHKLRGENPGIKSELEQLYQLLLNLLIGEDGMYFSTGFAALSYLGVKYKLDGKLLFRLHAFRKQLDSDRPSKEPEPWRSGFHSMATLVCNLTNSKLPKDFEEFYVADDQMQSESGEISDYLPWEKVLFTGEKTEDGWAVLREETGGETVIVQLDRAEVFEVGMRELQEIGAANINLLFKEIQVDSEGIWHPAIVLIEPDFILDVTAVASCIQPDGNFPAIHLLKKFLPPKTTKYILGGHVANYFLDRLMANPSLKYETLMAEAFFIDPIAFCTLSNEEVHYIASQARNYYRNLSRLIRENFLARGKDLNDFSIEPSFYSPQNGLQGRLDLLYRDPENRRIEIFELKSGSAFRPNAYKINPSHYAQTMLYYLIIKDLYSTGPNLSAYIIYAKDGGNTLRYAPAVKAIQQQTLAVRNQLFIRELKMQRLDKATPEKWIDYTGLGLLKGLKGFTGEDAGRVLAKWEQLDPLEKSYFRHFYAFVSREYRNSKINHRPNEDRNSGLSALWLDSQKNKEERFTLYTHLRVTEDRSTEENPLLTFSRENCPQTLANFRMGDVVVLYTTENEGNGTPFTQVYRGTLVELDGHSLTVRLRSKLSESDRPPRGAEWVLEPDVLESGFHHYFRSLALFLHAPGEKRKLWMGRRAPGKGELKPFPSLPVLTEEQNRVIQKIISSQDYFLLWGPPGTGKTSMVIKELIRHLVDRE